MTPVTPTISVTPATPITTPLGPSLSDLIAAIERPTDLPGAEPPALGLLGAADRQVAGSSRRGDSRPLASGAQCPWRNCITPGSA